MTLNKWLTKNFEHLLKIKASPDTIALGAAVGVFFGFIPLLGLKTLLAIGVTWIFGGNKLAAAIAVTLHDLLLPIVPMLIRFEYDLGYWISNNPHEFPPHLR